MLQCYRSCCISLLRKAVVLDWFATASWADKEPFLYSLFYTKFDVSKSQKETFHKMIRVFRKLPDHVETGGGLMNTPDVVGALTKRMGKDESVISREDLLLKYLTISTEPNKGPATVVEQRQERQGHGGAKPKIIVSILLS